MSGLFGVLNVASRALMVNQNQVRTVGHNIANASTPGYSRQSVVLASSPAIVNPTGNLGTGVEQISIERMHDRFVEQQLVREQSALGSSDTQATVLARIEEVLNEQDGPGLSTALGRFYDAFDDLASAATPGAPVEREAVRSAAQQLVDELHRADAELRTLQLGADADIAATVAQVNDLTARIAELNHQIVQQETGAPANDLRDQRDALVRELAGLAEITSFEQENGSAVVLLGGGLTLVDGSSARELGTAPDPANPFDPGFSRVVYDPDGTALDVTAEMGSGRLGGLLAARDSLLPAAIRALDTLAYNLAEQTNSVHSAGVGLDGSVGDFFVSQPAVEDAARLLAIDPAILASGDAIAAGLGGGAGDNRNALDLAALRDTATAVFLPGDPPGPASGPTRTILDHAASIVADVGQQARVAFDGRAQRERTVELLENRRDVLSGVSIDEEVAKLVELQSVFQANARVVATIQEMLDSVISIL
ncbi:MAG: flagellar hook-associated protein FlgK [Myxococcota bacterium]